MKSGWWLLAVCLYFAFPQLYAASFSGFYLPLMMVLWLLMLRGLGIELRTHIDNSVWQGFFDVVFSGASALLPIFFGAALGNVIRGVPLGPDGYFFEPLWTNFRAGSDPGDSGLVHGDGGHGGAGEPDRARGALCGPQDRGAELAERSRRLAVGLWPAQLILTLLSLAATYYVRPQVMNNYREYPIGLLVPVVVLGGLGLMIWGSGRGKSRGQTEAGLRGIRGST